MNTGLETVAAWEWLRRSLLANEAVAALLGDDPATAITSFPLAGGEVRDVVVLGVASAIDVNALGGEGALWVPSVFTVIASTREDFPRRAAALYSACHTVIEGMFNADDSPGEFGVVDWCERDSTIGPQPDRASDGSQEWTLGGTYRILSRSPLEE